MPFCLKDCSLNEQCRLAQANPGEFKELYSTKVLRSFKRGAVIFQENDPSSEIFCVYTGKVKLSRISPDGRETITKIVGKGSSFGISPLFNTKVQNVSATALEDCSICCLCSKNFLAQVEADSKLAIQVLTVLSLDLKEAEAKLLSLTQKNVRERLAELFITLGSAYGETEGARVRLDVRLTREEIASLIGSVNETVTRFISEFKEEGIIEEIDRAFYLSDVKRLYEFAGIK